MRLTQYTDYGLRLLIYLAVTPGNSASLGEIADSYKISKAHLKKVAQAMAANGLLTTQRGRTGGIKLVKEPTQIVIGSVVRQLEPDLYLVECMRPDNECVITPACRLRSISHEARAAVLAVFDRYTLADIVAHPRQQQELGRLLGIRIVAEPAGDQPSEP